MFMLRAFQRKLHANFSGGFMNEDLIFGELSKLQFSTGEKYITPFILEYYTLAAKKPNANEIELLDILKEKYKEAKKCE